MKVVVAAITCAALVTGCASVPQSCYETRGIKENPQPVYPPTSRKLGEEGKAILRVFVNSSGYPEAVELRQSSGYGNLDQSATETVKNWCFYPARTDGKPVGAWVLVPIVFRLEPQSLPIKTNP